MKRHGPIILDSSLALASATAMVVGLTLAERAPRKPAWITEAQEAKDRERTEREQWNADVAARKRAKKERRKK